MGTCSWHRHRAVNFDTILQRHRAVSLPQHGFLIGLCLQTALNHVRKNQSARIFNAHK